MPLDRKIRSAAEGAARARASEYDALVVDVGLPDAEGFELVATLRAQGVETPAIFLSARGEVRDRLEGFRAGGDDYLSKPFSLAELDARLRSIVGRGAAQHLDRLRVADLELDVAGGTATRAGRRFRRRAASSAPRTGAATSATVRRVARIVRREELEP